MKNRFLLFLAAVILLGSGTTALAEMRAGAFYIIPQIGGYLFEGNQNLDHSPTYGLGLGYTLDRHWATELSFNFIDAEFEAGGGSADGFLGRLDGLYHFRPDSRLVPYLAAGIGGIRLDPDAGSSDESFLINAGGGLKYFLTDTIAVRGDARYVRTFDETHNNLITTLSVDFHFGGKKKVAAAAAPADSDGDGVTDDNDRCPGTPGGVAVDVRGCPLDSDGDGVYDYQDKCPDTPVGAAVDRSGCPLDSDGDGVYDYKDKCPETPGDLKVDPNGCPVMQEEQVSIKLDIQFEINKADIRSQYHPQLKEVADFLQTFANTTAVIEGHTDNSGDAAYNKDLSQRRADSVRAYLIQNFGIDPNRLTAIGYGEQRPVASNDTRQGRAQNRRVVAVFTAAKQTYEKK